MQRQSPSLAALGILLLLLLAHPLGAAPVSPARAKAVASAAIAALRTRAGLAPLPTNAATVVATGEETGASFLYIISFPEGFALVSGDDVARPLLGYALHGSIGRPGAPLPLNIERWLGGYRQQIARAVKLNALPDPATRAAWSRLERGESATLTASGAAVGPLLRTAWDQYPYYNASCPYDREQGGQTLTGCVATAMAQVMKFWNYPEQGRGFYSYPHDIYGTMAASFGNTHYRWGEMPDTLTGPNSAVATLMLHCGVGAQMEYSTIESLASVIEMRTSPLKTCAETALERFFGYDPATTQGLLRSDFTTDGWLSILRNELDSGRPIIYAGYSEDRSGHCFVCDGYQEEYFHMNWGWSGSFNGYFLLDALNPDSAGVGEGGFNILQEAIVGIKPLAPATSRLELDAPLALLPATPLPYNGALSITAEVANRGSGSFNGDLSAAAFDSAGNVVAFLGVSRNHNLSPNGEAVLTFDTSGLSRLFPGTYTLSICERAPGGEWGVLPSGLHPNALQFRVANPSSITLSESLTVAGNDRLETEGTLDGTAEIRNGTGTGFKGTVALRLYGLDGVNAGTIGAEQEVEMAAGESKSLQFSVDTLKVGAGTYFLALTSTAEGSERAELVEDGGFANPVQVVVQAFARDIYEPNNSVATAAPLPAPSLEGTIVTTRANIHIANDTDWYSLVLPPGDRYAVTARVHDALTHDDGNIYTNDVLFITVLNGDTSAEYDSGMTAPMTLQGGDTLFFQVAAYFDGDRGSYTLEIKVDEAAGAEREEPLWSRIEAAPNPTRSGVELRLPSDVTPRSVSVIDARGAVCRTLPATGNPILVPLDGLPPGPYTLVVGAGERRYRASVLKAE